MKLNQALLKEYDLEMEFVRRHLERVPDRPPVLHLGGQPIEF